MHNANISLIISASEEDAVLQSAIDTFANKTCIKFKVRTNEVDYISVKKLSGLYYYINFIMMLLIYKTFSLKTDASVQLDEWVEFKNCLWAMAVGLLALCNMNLCTPLALNTSKVAQIGTNTFSYLG